MNDWDDPLMTWEECLCLGVLIGFVVLLVVTYCGVQVDEMVKAIANAFDV